MKVVFDKSEMIAAVSPAMGSVSNKNTLAAAEGILIKTDGSNLCILSAFDLEKGIRIPVPAKVFREGSCIINAVKLNSIIRLLPESEVTLEIDMQKKAIAKISSGKSVYELHALNGEDFPAIPELNCNGAIEIPQCELRKMITQTLFAVAQNDVRPALNGSLFKLDHEQLTVVSCDGNRLAVKEKRCSIHVTGTDGSEPAPLSYKFIVPGKTLAELVKLLSDSDDTILIKIARKHVIFKIGDMYFFSRLIDEDYIDYERVIPKTNKIFASVNCAELEAALERALPVTEDKSMGQNKSTVKCSFSDHTLKLSSVSNSGTFFDELDIEKSGDDIEIHFNCKYFIECIRCCDTDFIKLSLSSPLMSMIIEADEEKQAPKNDEEEDKGKFLFLLLPVRA